MGQPAAKQGDRIVATDTHAVTIVAVTTAMTFPFNGVISAELSRNVNIMGRAAATVGSTAINTPPHTTERGRFQRPPSNRGRIVSGSATVFINGKPAARAGDTAMTCNDPTDRPVGRVVAAGTVLIG